MLINSLSLLFAFTSFISWWEALAVGLAIVGLVFSVTAEPAEQWEFRTPATLYYYLQWSWLGYLRLKDAFWPFFILFNIILLYIDYRVQESTFTVASWITIHIILAMPLVYWTGAVWRCSMQCSSRIWVILARSVTIAAYLEFALRWVIYQYYPNIFFSCQQMLMQWGDCV